MKLKIAVVTGALWCAALPGLAQETAPESPQDYAWGRSLTTTASSPWYRVALPDDVYQQSVWPDLRDVRVFNHQGERVPFTLQVQQEVQPARVDLHRTARRAAISATVLCAAEPPRSMALKPS